MQGGRRPPLFLMNVLNLILFKGYYYCFCENFEKKNNKEKRSLCRIPTIFENFEKKLDYNMENPVFLKAYHAKLVPYLVQILDMDKSAIECFLNDEHAYSGRDWNTEIKWSVGLKESIEYTKYLKKN